MDKRDRIKELTALLSKASEAYYMHDTEIMSNYEYDALYDELKGLEEETGLVLSGSPTVKVGYDVVSELPKEDHEYPMLSLDKTKDANALSSWLGSQKGLLSWKLDGLTVVLKYSDGKLIKAVTRGNGRTGEVITPNARVFKNIPHQISYKGELTIRGEAVIRYSDFNRINSEIEDVALRYKNPRNLCSGSVRQQNSAITAKRNVYLYAFALVAAEGVDFENSRLKQFEWLASQGFDVVEYAEVTSDSLPGMVESFAERIEDNDFPSDGLVLIMDDIAYGESLGSTAKFPRNAMAFKWADEIRDTKLKEVEWSASRTGLINPIAIFEPVELEGTTVSRASLHNISILKALQLGIGDTIQVYKANMIIPQIAENLTRSDTLKIPDTCPVCGHQTELVNVNDTVTLYCPNEECEAKHVKRFTHFVSRDALNIEGMSEATLEKFIQKGFLHRFSDIYHLSAYEDEIVAMDGFGKKSYDNLIAAIEKSRSVQLAHVIYSLGIPEVGLSGARLICSHLSYDVEKLISASAEDLKGADGIGPVIADNFTAYFKNEENRQAFNLLLAELRIMPPDVTDEESSISGMTFVITGSLNSYKNRGELKKLIESKGGKVAGSVSSKTDYLINNDSLSGSSKNKKAHELGVKIITEEEFADLL